LRTKVSVIPCEVLDLLTAFQIGKMGHMIE
jgi:hypothetical protein